MNAVGLVQSKWLLNFVQGPLRPYFDEQYLISILCFYIVFVHLLLYFEILQISHEEKF